MTQRYTERPFADLLPKCPKQLGPEIRANITVQISHLGGRNQKTWVIQLSCLPRSGIRGARAGTQTRHSTVEYKDYNARLNARSQSTCFFFSYYAKIKEDTVFYSSYIKFCRVKYSHYLPASYPPYLFTNIKCLLSLSLNWNSFS